MMRLLLLLSAVISPILVTTSIVDRQNEVAQTYNQSTVRRSQNIEIAPSTESAIAALSPTISTPTPTSAPSFPLEISHCASQPGNANLHNGDQVIGIISSGTTVNLTGNVVGEWVEVSGSHWPTGANRPTTGTGWIHQCWVSPESMVSLESDPAEPLGLLVSRRRGRSFRSASLPRRSYMQSTGELVEYVGRDLYNYALLYPRIAAYQSFWNYATDSSPSYYSTPVPQSSYYPSQVDAQVIDLSPGADQELAYTNSQHSYQPPNAPVYPDMHHIHPKMIERLGIVPGEPLMPWQQTLLRGNL